MAKNSEAELFAALAALDTPTVCNALEVVCGGRRDFGYTRQTMIASPVMRPFVGRAVTAAIRAVARPDADKRRRLDFYRRIAPATAAVIADLDRPRGRGAFWGEVHSAVFASLGAAGVVTDGAIRDLDALDSRLPILAGGVSPSHAFVDIEEIDLAVEIFGMAVKPGEIIHADRHGAVVLPDDAAAAIPAAAALLARREQVVLDAAKRDGFCAAALEQAFDKMGEIH